MSYGENPERRKSYRSFRTTMDIGMGVFYTVIGAMLAIMRSFADMKIPTLVALLLGGMMFVGGLFRLYRGIKAVWPRNHNADRAN